MLDIQRDFRKFALSNGVSRGAVDSLENQVFPTVIEERSSAMRAVEMNVFSRLIQDRIVFLSDDVTSDSMDVISAQLLYLDSVDDSDINLYINSGGGDCYSGLELVSVMDFVSSDISTTVLGLAASMAAVISSSGTKGKRFVLPYSRFMIHQPSSSFGYSKYTDSTIALKEMESVKNDLYEILSKNSGNSIDDVEKMCSNGDLWMKGQQVIDNNWADSVIKSRKK